MWLTSNNLRKLFDGQPKSNRHVERNRENKMLTCMRIRGV